jgi:hypothetical protein
MLALIPVLALMLAFPLERLHRYRVSLKNEERCWSQIKQIGLGLLAYHETHGRFPPSALTGKDGQPQLSWRAVVLPNINWAIDFSGFAHDEPWDGPSNIRGSLKGADFFVCPNHSARDKASVTSYVLITGPGTFFEEGKPRAAVSQMMKDNPQCFLVVETTSNNSNWAAPGDISIEDLSVIVNYPDGNSISSNDPHGPAVFLSTGEVRRIKSIQQLRQLIPILPTLPGRAK